ncbi:hypothetical protein AURDEDRAFT_110541 [Auricularia subglabra TFB-10046 SS5]|nr:hypothetical protein AURDEDRAFT_110541 [Auricularia subglabra TFB-10046 SS5]
MSTVPLLLLPLVVALVRCRPVNPDDEDLDTSDPQPPHESVRPDEPDGSSNDDDDGDGAAMTGSKTSTRTGTKTKSRTKTRSRTSTKKPTATKPVAHGPIIQPSPTLTSSGSSLPTPSPATARSPSSRHSVAGTVLGALFGSIAGVILVVFVLRWYSIWQRRRRQQQRNGGASSPNTRQIQGQWVSSQTGRTSASSVEPPPPYFNGSAPAYDTPQAAAAPFSYTAGAHTPR